MPALLLRLPTASQELTTLVEPEDVVAPTLRERLALSSRNLVGLGVILLFALLFASGTLACSQLDRLSHSF